MIICSHDESHLSGPRCFFTMDCSALKAKEAAVTGKKKPKQNNWTSWGRNNFFLILMEDKYIILDYLHADIMNVLPA